MQWYTGTTILSVNFPPKAVVDLEVVDRPAIENLLKSFITEHHVAPSAVIIVLSASVYLSEDFTDNKEISDDMRNEFISTVPFEEYTVKQYKIEKGYRLVSVSKTLYELMRQTLEKNNFQIAGVIPEFVLGTQSTKRWLDEDMARAVIKSVDTIKDYNLLSAEEVTEQAREKHQVFMTKNKRAMILGGVFFFLILILIVLIIKQGI
jgi:hypothetical protein